MSNLTMGFVAGDLVDARSSSKPAARPTWSLSSLLERMSNAVYATEQRRRENEVARFLQDNGGVLTDDLERQISRRYGNIVGQ